MPARHVAVFALVVALTSVAAAGCASEEPEVSASPSRSLAPVFTSDAQALSEATEAFTAYQAAVDSAFQSGDISGLPEFASEPLLGRVSDEVSEFTASGQTQTGAVDVSQVVLVNKDVRSQGPSDPLQVYACLNVSEVGVFDATGMSTVSPNRPTYYPVIATLVWDSSSLVLLTSDQQVWDSDDFCE